MIYEFITIGGGEYFVDIFNGIAMICNSGDYIDIIKITASLALVFTLVAAAFSGSITNSAKWYTTTFLVLNILIYPKATLHITDRANPGLMGATVANVPFVVAYTAEVTSNIGSKLTSLFESVFSLPDDLSYTENGIIFGVDLWKAVSQYDVTDPNLASSLDSFTKNCIFYDIQLGIYSFKELKNSTNIWEFVKSHQTGNRFFTYTSLDNNISYPSCKEGSSLIDNDWKSEYTGNFWWKNLGVLSNRPGIDEAVLNSTVPEAANYFLGVVGSSQQILQQSMMINMINTSAENYEAEHNILLYQNARATMQARLTYQTMGKQAGMWIPILKIVIEALFYASFPLIAMIAIMPNSASTVLRGYFMTFVWLASWGPMYAILHRISMGRAKTYTFGLSGFTIENHPGIEMIMNDIAAMAGYMSMFIPMISYGLAKGGAAAMSNMTTSFMSGIQGAVSSAAYEGSTGNLSFGNVSMGSKNISSGVSITNSHGQVMRHWDDGSTSLDNSMVESKLGYDVNAGQSLLAQVSKTKANEQSITDSSQLKFNESRAESFEKLHSQQKSIENSDSFEKVFSSSERDSFNKISKSSDEFSTQHNISKESAHALMAGVSSGLPLKNILSRIPGSSLVEKIPVVGDVINKAEVNGGYQYRHHKSDQDLYQEAQHYVKEHNLSHDYEVVENAIQSSKYNLLDSKGESVSDQFRETASLEKEYNHHKERTERLGEIEENIKNNSVNVSKNLNQKVWSSAVEKYGTTKAAEIFSPSNHDSALSDKVVNDVVKDEWSKYENNIDNFNIPKDIGQQVINDKLQQSSSLMQNSNPYSFSSSKKQIDHSNLSQDVANNVEETHNIIGSKKVEDFNKGKEIKKEIEDAD